MSIAPSIRSDARRNLQTSGLRVARATKKNLSGVHDNNDLLNSDESPTNTNNIWNNQQSANRMAPAIFGGRIAPCFWDALWRRCACAAAPVVRNGGNHTD